MSSTSLAEKYRTLKAKKSIKRPTVVTADQLSKSTSALCLSSSVSSTSTKVADAPLPSPKTSSPPTSYAAFLADLVATFNSLSSTSATPTPSATASTLLRTSYHGTDHEIQVDSQQKKKIAKALQKANPSQVNEVIAILKTMPDPTAPSSSSPQRQLSTRGLKESAEGKARKQKQDRLDQELGEWNKVQRKRSSDNQKCNDQSTGTIDPTSGTSSSWWFGSLIPFSAPNSTDSKTPPVKDTPADSTSWFSSWGKPPMDPSLPKKKTSLDSNKKTLSTGEQIAQAAASLMASATVTRSKTRAPKADSTTLRRFPSVASALSIKSTTLQSAVTTTATSKPAASTLFCTTTTTTTTARKPTTKTLAKTKSNAVAVSEPSFLVTTINSITRQFLTAYGPPPTFMISAYTYWWGYEIYVPHKCMAKIERVSNTSQVFLGLLSGAISGIPGLAALIPIAKIIAAWVGYQWSVIKAEDLGKGVVISATWVLPVALASRSWDHPGNEDDPPSPPRLVKQKSKLKLIKLWNQSGASV